MTKFFIPFCVTTRELHTFYRFMFFTILIYKKRITLLATGFQYQPIKLLIPPKLIHNTKQGKFPKPKTPIPNHRSFSPTQTHHYQMNPSNPTATNRRQLFQP